MWVVLMGWVEERSEDAVGCSGNLSGTYWLIVIRAGVSRAATTTTMSNAGDGSIAILDRPVNKTC